MHVKIKLISTVMTVTLPLYKYFSDDGDIGSCMDNECVMNLYDHELDGMKFWITYEHNGQIMLLYNSCLDG